MIDEEFWADIYGQLAPDYTPDEIRAMTLQDVDRIFRGWRRNPPPRMLLMGIAAALGIKMPAAQLIEKPKYMTADEARALMRATGGKIDGIARLAG